MSIDRQGYTNELELGRYLSPQPRSLLSVVLSYLTVAEAYELLKAIDERNSERSDLLRVDYPITYLSPSVTGLDLAQMRSACESLYTQFTDEQNSPQDQELSPQSSIRILAQTQRQFDTLREQIYDEVPFHHPQCIEPPASSTKPARVAQREGSEATTSNSPCTQAVRGYRYTEVSGECSHPQQRPHYTSNKDKEGVVSISSMAAEGEDDMWALLVARRWPSLLSLFTRVRHIHLPVPSHTPMDPYSCDNAHSTYSKHNSMHLPPPLPAPTRLPSSTATTVHTDISTHRTALPLYAMDTSPSTCIPTAPPLCRATLADTQTQVHALLPHAHASPGLAPHPHSPSTQVIQTHPARVAAAATKSISVETAAPVQALAAAMAPGVGARVGCASASVSTITPESATTLAFSGYTGVGTSLPTQHSHNTSLTRLTDTSQARFTIPESALKHLSALHKSSVKANGGGDTPGDAAAMELVLSELAVHANKRENGLEWGRGGVEDKGGSVVREMRRQARKRERVTRAESRLEKERRNMRRQRSWGSGALWARGEAWREGLGVGCEEGNKQREIANTRREYEDRTQEAAEYENEDVDTTDYEDGEAIHGLRVRALPSLIWAYYQQNPTYKQRLRSHYHMTMDGSGLGGSDSPQPHSVSLLSRDGSDVRTPPSTCSQSSVHSSLHAATPVQVSTPLSTATTAPRITPTSTHTSTSKTTSPLMCPSIAGDPGSTSTRPHARVISEYGARATYAPPDHSSDMISSDDTTRTSAVETGLGGEQCGLTPVRKAMCAGGILSILSPIPEHDISERLWPDRVEVLEGEYGGRCGPAGDGVGVNRINRANSGKAGDSDVTTSSPTQTTARSNGGDSSGQDNIVGGGLGDNSPGNEPIIPFAFPAVRVRVFTWRAVYTLTEWALSLYGQDNHGIESTHVSASPGGHGDCVVDSDNHRAKVIITTSAVADAAGESSNSSDNNTGCGRGASAVIGVGIGDGLRDNLGDDANPGTNATDTPQQATRYMFDKVADAFLKALWYITTPEKPKPGKDRKSRKAATFPEMPPDAPLFFSLMCASIAGMLQTKLHAPTMSCAATLAFGRGYGHYSVLPQLEKRIAVALCMHTIAMGKHPREDAESSSLSQGYVTSAGALLLGDTVATVAPEQLNVANCMPAVQGHINGGPPQPQSQGHSIADVSPLPGSEIWAIKAGGARGGVGHGVGCSPRGSTREDSKPAADEGDVGTGMTTIGGDPVGKKTPTPSVNGHDGPQDGPQLSSATSAVVPCACAVARAALWHAHRELLLASYSVDMHARGEKVKATGEPVGVPSEIVQETMVRNDKEKWDGGECPLDYRLMSCKDGGVGANLTDSDAERSQVLLQRQRQKQCDLLLASLLTSPCVAQLALQALVATKTPHPPLDALASPSITHGLLQTHAPPCAAEGLPHTHAALRTALPTSEMPVSVRFIHSTAMVERDMRESTVMASTTATEALGAGTGAPEAGGAALGVYDMEGELPPRHMRAQRQLHVTNAYMSSEPSTTPDDGGALYTVPYGGIPHATSLQDDMAYSDAPILRNIKSSDTITSLNTAPLPCGDSWGWHEYSYATGSSPYEPTRHIPHGAVAGLGGLSHAGMSARGGIGCGVTKSNDEEGHGAVTRRDQHSAVNNGMANRSHTAALGDGDQIDGREVSPPARDTDAHTDIHKAIDTQRNLYAGAHGQAHPGDLLSPTVSVILTPTLGDSAVLARPMDRDTATDASVSCLGNTSTAPVVSVIADPIAAHTATSGASSIGNEDARVQSAGEMEEHSRAMVKADKRVRAKVGKAEEVSGRERVQRMNNVDTGEGHARGVSSWGGRSPVVVLGASVCVRPRTPIESTLGMHASGKNMFWGKNEVPKLRNINSSDCISESGKIIIPSDSGCSDIPVLHRSHQPTYTYTRLGTQLLAQGAPMREHTTRTQEGMDKSMAGEVGWKENKRADVGGFGNEGRIAKTRGMGNGRGHIMNDLRKLEDLKLPNEARGQTGLHTREGVNTKHSRYDSETGQRRVALHKVLRRLLRRLATSDDYEDTDRDGGRRYKREHDIRGGLCGGLRDDLCGEEISPQHPIVPTHEYRLGVRTTLLSDSDTEHDKNKGKSRGRGKGSTRSTRGNRDGVNRGGVNARTYAQESDAESTSDGDSVSASCSTSEDDAVGLSTHQRSAAMRAHRERAHSRASDRTRASMLVQRVAVKRIPFTLQAAAHPLAPLPLNGDEDVETFEVREDFYCLGYVDTSPRIQGKHSPQASEEPTLDLLSNSAIFMTPELYNAHSIDLLTPTTVEVPRNRSLSPRNVDHQLMLHYRAQVAANGPQLTATSPQAVCEGEGISTADDDGAQGASCSSRGVNPQLERRPSREPLGAGEGDLIEVCTSTKACERSGEAAEYSLSDDGFRVVLSTKSGIDVAAANSDMGSSLAESAGIVAGRPRSAAEDAPESPFRDAAATASRLRSEDEGYSIDLKGSRVGTLLATTREDDERIPNTINQVISFLSAAAPKNIPLERQELASKKGETYAYGQTKTTSMEQIWGWKTSVEPHNDGKGFMSTGAGSRSGIGGETAGGTAACITGRSQAVSEDSRAGMGVDVNVGGVGPVLAQEHVCATVHNVDRQRASSAHSSTSTLTASSSLFYCVSTSASLSPDSTSPSPCSALIAEYLRTHGWTWPQFQERYQWICGVDVAMGDSPAEGRIYGGSPGGYVGGSGGADFVGNGRMGKGVVGQEGSSAGVGLGGSSGVLASGDAWLQSRIKYEDEEEQPDNASGNTKHSNSRTGNRRISHRGSEVRGIHEAIKAGATGGKGRSCRSTGGRLASIAEIGETEVEVDSLGDEEEGGEESEKVQREHEMRRMAMWSFIQRREMVHVRMGSGRQGIQENRVRPDRERGRHVSGVRATAGGTRRAKEHEGSESPEGRDALHLLENDLSCSYTEDINEKHTYADHTNNSKGQINTSLTLHAHEAAMQQDSACVFAVVRECALCGGHGYLPRLRLQRPERASIKTTNSSIDACSDCDVGSFGNGSGGCSENGVGYQEEHDGFPGVLSESSFRKFREYILSRRRFSEEVKPCNCRDLPLTSHYLFPSSTLRSEGSKTLAPNISQNKPRRAHGKREGEEEAVLVWVRGYPGGSVEMGQLGVVKDEERRLRSSTSGFGSALRNAHVSMAEDIEGKGINDRCYRRPQVGGGCKHDTPSHFFRFHWSRPSYGHEGKGIDGLSGEDGAEGMMGLPIVRKPVRKAMRVESRDMYLGDVDRYGYGYLRGGYTNKSWSSEGTYYGRVWGHLGNNVEEAEEETDEVRSGAPVCLRSPTCVVSPVTSSWATEGLESNRNGVTRGNSSAENSGSTAFSRTTLHSEHKGSEIYGSLHTLATGQPLSVTAIDASGAKQSAGGCEDVGKEVDAVAGCQDTAVSVSGKKNGKGVAQSRDHMETIDTMASEGRGLLVKAGCLRRGQRLRERVLGQRKVKFNSEVYYRYIARRGEVHEEEGDGEGRAGLQGGLEKQERTEEDGRESSRGSGLENAEDGDEGADEREEEGDGHIEMKVKENGREGKAGEVEVDVEVIREGSAEKDEEGQATSESTGESKGGKHGSSRVRVDAHRGACVCVSQHDGVARVARKRDDSVGWAVSMGVLRYARPAVFQDAGQEAEEEESGESAPREDEGDEGEDTGEESAEYESAKEAAQRLRTADAHGSDVAIAQDCDETSVCVRELIDARESAVEWLRRLYSGCVGNVSGRVSPHLDVVRMAVHSNKPTIIQSKRSISMDGGMARDGEDHTVVQGCGCDVDALIVALECMTAD